MEDVVKIEDGQIVVAKDTINKIKQFYSMKKEMEYQEKLLKDGLMEAMKEQGIISFDIDNEFRAIIKDGYSRTTIDSKRLKDEVPEIYEEYSKTTEVKPSIVLSIN